MPKKKTEVAQYRFVQTVSYAPLGDKEYPAGSTDALSDWDTAHVENALRAGLIEVATAAETLSAVEELAAPLLEQPEIAGEEDNK